MLSPGSYRAALHAAGGACAMVDALLAGEARAAFCGTRPPGHHARSETTSGFCLFNNVAVAAQARARRAAAPAGSSSSTGTSITATAPTTSSARATPCSSPASIRPASSPGRGRCTTSAAARARASRSTCRAAGSDGDAWISLLEHVAVPPPRVPAGPGAHLRRLRRPPRRRPGWLRARGRRPSPRWPATCGRSARRWALRSAPCWRAATRWTLSPPRWRPRSRRSPAISRPRWWRRTSSRPARPRTSGDTTPLLLKLVVTGRLNVDDFATHHFKLHDMMDAYDTFGRAAETKALKVVIDR